MPRYLAIHHAPGVNQEDFQRNMPEVLKGKHATFVHTYVNLAHGTIVNIYDAESPDALRREFERVGFPFDEIQEVQFAASADDLRKMIGAAT
jgi:Nickel responsive protein SCO4226-like